MKDDVSIYIGIIQNFIEGIISVDDFEKQYLEAVKKGKYIYDDDNARIIGTLFSDVDSYCGDPEIANYDPNDTFADIDEVELRKRAKRALDELKQKNNT